MANRPRNNERKDLADEDSRGVSNSYRYRVIPDYRFDVFTFFMTRNQLMEYLQMPLSDRRNLKTNIKLQKKWD